VLQEHNMGLCQKFCYKFVVFYHDIRLSGRISGNLPDIRSTPDIRPDTGYPALIISRISGIRYPAKKVSGPTLY